MTPHLRDFVRTMNWYTETSGPVLEIGSYIEANQEYLDMRLAFPPGPRYVGVDLIEGSGVDQVADLLDQDRMLALVDDIQPRAVLCLYVLEHLWNIREAAKVLGSMWQRNPESWLWISTHQNQPYHGTGKYPDYWRITAEGMKRLMEESGVDDPKVFVLESTTNPEDVVAVRQPKSMAWPGEAMTKTVNHLIRESKVKWEQYA